MEQCDNKKNTITLYTIAYGDYWEKYGERWEQNIKKLDPQPDEIYIISDKPIATDFKYYIYNNDHPVHKLSYFRNYAVSKSTSLMTSAADIDDIHYSWFLKNVNFNFDIHYFSKKEHNNIVKTEEQIFKYLKAFNLIMTPSPIKTELLKKIKYDAFGWEDRIMCIKLFKNGAKMFVDPTPRFEWTSEGKERNGRSSLTKPKTKKEMAIHKIKHNEYRSFVVTGEIFDNSKEYNKVINIK